MVERILRDVSDLALGLILLLYGFSYKKELHQEITIIKYVHYWIVKSILIFLGVLGLFVVIFGLFMEPY